MGTFFYQIFFELRFRQISTILNVWSILIAKTSSVMNFQTFLTSHFKGFSDLVFEKKKRKKLEKFEKSMIFGCFLTFLASIIIVESWKTIKHSKTVWIWRKNDFSSYFDKKNVPIKKTVTDAFFLSPDKIKKIFQFQGIFFRQNSWQKNNFF